MSIASILRILLTAGLLIPVWIRADWSVALVLTLIVVRLELDEIFGWEKLRLG
jgi:hypothetical protein